jgi:Fe-S-cluster containining protein
MTYTLGCSRCGDCCDQIWLPAAKITSIRAAIDAGDPESRISADMRADCEFIETHWTVEERSLDGQDLRYVCDRFDAEARLCTAYEQRPPVCTNFPYYGRTAIPAPDRLPSRCSFAFDVAPELRRSDARPLIPIEVIHR